MCKIHVASRHSFDALRHQKLSVNRGEDKHPCNRLRRNDTLCPVMQAIVKYYTTSVYSNQKSICEASVGPRKENGKE